MNRDQIFEKLTAVFQDIFANEDITINEKTSAEDIEEWDSLTHIMLLSAMESEFNIKFDIKAVQGLKNVGEMVDLIERLKK